MMMNPDYCWRRQDKDHKCRTVSVNNKKNCYVSTEDKCKTKPLLNLWDSDYGSVPFENGVLTEEIGSVVLKTPSCIVGKTTSPLPHTNISAVETETKAFQPQNKALRNLKCC